MTSKFLEAEEIPQHLIDLRQLQENMLPQDTSYRHRDSEVTWKGDNGATKYVCHTDCSGLIDRLLEHTYGISKIRLKDWLGGRIRPRTKNYYQAVKDQNGFEHLENVKLLRPGDFIAIKFLPGSGDRGHDTGHIMVVNGYPVETEGSSKQNPNLQQWSIDIIDCSHGHGKSDSRYHDGKYWPGIGKGNFALYTNQNGGLIGYSWTPSPNSIFYGEDKRPLAAGRLNSNIIQR